MRACSNLVANALRRAAPSKVVIRISSDEGYQLIVSDDGKGMDQDTLVRSLDPGVRSKASKGDGLGLAIVSELAQRHGFRFDLASKEGGGTIATLADLYVSTL